MNAFLDIPLTDGRHLPCHNTNLLLTDYEGLNSRSQSSRFSESAAILDYGFSMIR
jgi:hypothetical protein